MLEYLVKGTLLGLAAGMMPGPLLVLVVSETIKHNTAAGIKVAMAPILTDVPVILLALLVLPKLPYFELILGAISIGGAVFILYLAYESFTTSGLDLDPGQVKRQSLMKGVVTNFLSPHPYVFWIGVGVPILYTAYQEGWQHVTAFIIASYFFIVGAKVALALAVNRSRTFLSGPVYIFIVRGLGAALALFAIFLIRDGIRFLSG